MENERIVLDGFRYEIHPGTILQEGNATPLKVTRVTFHDDERGISLETWWPEQAWEDFKRDVNGGVYVPTRDAIERLGI